MANPDNLDFWNWSPSYREIRIPNAALISAIYLRQRRRVPLFESSKNKRGDPLLVYNFHFPDTSASSSQGSDREIPGPLLSIRERVARRVTLSFREFLDERYASDLIVGRFDRVVVRLSEKCVTESPRLSHFLRSRSFCWNNRRCFQHRRFVVF